MQCYFRLSFDSVFIVGRPVHYTEEVTPIILRWTDWNGSNICEYSSNYLCVRKDTVFDRVAKRVRGFFFSPLDILNWRAEWNAQISFPQERTPLSLTQQLRFSKEKSFKKVSMDFSKMTLAVHKSSTVSSKKRKRTNYILVLTVICWSVHKNRRSRCFLARSRFIRIVYPWRVFHGARKPKKKSRKLFFSHPNRQILIFLPLNFLRLPVQTCSVSGVKYESHREFVRSA